MLTRGIRRDSHRRMVVARTWLHEGFLVASVDVAATVAGPAWPPGRTLAYGSPRRPSSPMLLPSPRDSRLSGKAEHMSQAAINRYGRLHPVHYGALGG